jgi:RNA polymerase sigma factor (TIGR02999 family)
MATDSTQVTQLLKAWGRGDAGALDRLTPLVYDELKRLARHYMRGEDPRRTLQPTALVNEAFVRLVDVQGVDWNDRTHFFAMSARIMRRILVDAARARASAKRGGGLQRVDDTAVTRLDDFPAALDTSTEIVALDDALVRLADMDPRRAQVIELRFFGGLSVEETGQALRVSPQTVMRDWKLARAWLARELAPR